MAKSPKKKPKTKKRGGGNARGRLANAEEDKDMRLLGYGTVAEAAKAVKRAASSVYERVHRDAIPQAFSDRKPWVRGPSGNVWVHLETIRKVFAPPVAAATGEAAS